MRQAVVCRKRKLDHERRPMPHLTADANSTTVRLDDFRDDCLPQTRPQLSPLEVTTVSAARSVSADRVDEGDAFDLDQGASG
jgi:hypothetical protein